MTENIIGKKLKGPNQELFKITAFLGRGSFGNVYKAKGETSEKIVAVKTALTNNDFDSPSFALKSLNNEIKHAMLEIRHPNVVSYLYVNVGEGDRFETEPYVMMEFVEGGTLLDLLRRLKKDGKKLSLEKAVSLMRGIALGAEAINEKVIHRDVKPDNILLAGDENNYIPRITDFGISKIAVEPTRPETFKGTQAVSYMAPEVWNQDRHSFKIDVYSIGLVFYEILTLQNPLLSQIADPSNFLDWRDAHLNKLCPDVRQIRSDVPAHLAKLLLNMTDKFPVNRPAWGQTLEALNFEKPQNTSIEIDPELLETFTRQADEQFRAEQSQMAAKLKEAEKQNLLQRRREEYNQAFIKLINSFDQIIETLNEQISGVKIVISGEQLNRTYKMPNGRIFSSINFGYIPNGQSNILGGGFMGVSGGLTANLAFQGSHENISEGFWTAIEVTMPLISGDRKLDLYRRAGIDDATIRYVEYLDYDKSWRRDLPSFFGIRNSELFFSKIGFSGLDVYQLISADLIKTFSEILKVAMKMPSQS